MERLTLDQQLSSAAMARHWVCERCPAEHLPEARRWIAELLTSELVANALEHGSGPVVLSLTHDEEGILVGISDGDTGVPALHPQLPGATAGRGIALVDALATAWGHYPNHQQDPGQDPEHGEHDGHGHDADGHRDDGWPVPDADELPAPGRAGKTVWFHLATR